VTSTGTRASCSFASSGVRPRAVFTISIVASVPPPRVTTMSPAMLASARAPSAPSRITFVVRSVCSSRLSSRVRR
jgi:hypothetical protein